MDKKVMVILSQEAKEAYEKLEQMTRNAGVEASVLKSIKKKVELIKQNPHYGEKVGKRLIPKKLVEKYGINNLFWVSLSGFWRMLYTLTSKREIEIIAFVLHISDHREYDKLMKYKKK